MANPNRCMARQAKNPMVEVTDWNKSPEGDKPTVGWAGEMAAKEVAEAMRKVGVVGARATSWKGCGRQTKWKVQVRWDAVAVNREERHARDTTVAAVMAEATK